MNDGGRRGDFRGGRFVRGRLCAYSQLSDESKVDNYFADAYTDFVIRFCFLYVLAQLPFMCFYGRMTAAADKKLSASSGIAPLIAGYMFFAAGVVFWEDWSRDHAGDTEFVPAKKLAVGAAISAYICGGFIFCCLAVAGVASLPSLWLVTLGVAAMGWSVCWEYEPDSVYRAYEARGDKKRYFAHSKQTDKIGYPVLFISVAVIILGLILGAA